MKRDKIDLNDFEYRPSWFFSILLFIFCWPWYVPLLIFENSCIVYNGVCDKINKDVKRGRMMKRV